MATLSTPHDSPAPSSTYLRAGLHEHALACVDQGWAVFPLVPNTKRPLTDNGFKDASKDIAQIQKWWTEHPNANVGLATGKMSGIVAVDVDVKEGAKGRESISQLKGLPPTLTVSTPSGGWHLYYTCPPEGLRSRVGVLPGIDVRGDGGYVVASGSLIDGKPYEYQDAEAHLVSLPADIVGVFNRTNGSRPRSAGPIIKDSIPEGTRNSTLASLAGTMRRRGLGIDEITAELKAINAKRCVPPLSDKDVEAIAASIARYPDSKGEGAQTDDQSEAEQPMPSGFSDDALAAEFTAKHGEDLRYVAAWGYWLHWDGSCWRRETTLRAFDSARLICRGISADCDDLKIAARITSASTVAAVERLARADRRHAATIEQWDANPWLLNTQGSVVDLQTGEVRVNMRADFMTKIALATPVGSMDKQQPLLWLAFLNDVTNGDTDLQAYLARVAGYALTGVTTEHALFFFFGTGANGKSVFLNTLAAILGDYATNAPMDTFMESKSDRHPTDLAGLRGARLVTAIEVENGRRWAESKIKSLTGGDKISARFMRQDFFEYVPQFKLLIAGNNKPSIRDVDEAMKRRMHLIPFTVTIPPHRRDHGLAQKLLAEKDGILRWAIDGCLAWQREGLKPPARVIEATEEYLEAEDAMGRWLEENCDRNPSARTTTNDLFTSWKTWSDHGGEYVGTIRKFSEDVAKRGFARWKSGSLKGFRGIALKDQEVEEVQVETL